MTDKSENTKQLRRATNIIMLFGIPIIGIILTFPMSNGEYEFFSTEHYISMFFSVVVTASFWFSCMYVVTFLWEKYPWHINPVKHLLIEILSIVLISLMIIIIMFYTYSLFGDPIDKNEFLSVVSLSTIVSLFLTTFHEAFFFYNQWKYNFNKSAVLEKDNVIAKYETLKSQINPHFLFNSLNTLLEFVENNKVAEDYIQTLSEFLRYTLANKDTEIKSLQDEISIVEKYYYLQNSRFGKNLNLVIEIDERFNEYYLPSLSLQILVENAIKHNEISVKNPLNIRIFIKDDSYIVVENNLKRRMNSNSTNTGLKNIINRYKFLSSNDVIVNDNNSKFTVELPLLILK